MATFKESITEAKCHELHRVVDTTSGKFLCFTRFDSDSLTLCASDGYDLWKIDMDADEYEAHRDLADLNSDAYLAKFRGAFQTGNIMISQMGVKCTVTLGHGTKSLDFELYEAKAVEKKTELQGILFRLAFKAEDFESQLEKANATIDNLKQHKATGAGGGGIFDIGDGGKKKGQPKAPPKQVGMSVLNPGSKKRKAARGVQFD